MKEKDNENNTKDWELKNGEKKCRSMNKKENEEEDKLNDFVITFFY